MQELRGLPMIVNIEEVTWPSSHREPVSNSTVYPKPCQFYMVTSEALDPSLSQSTDRSSNSINDIQNLSNSFSCHPLVV